MGYWFDKLSEDELVATALLLGVEFMSPHNTIRGYGPYWRFSLPAQEILDYQFHGGWSFGYMDRGNCARNALKALERRKQT